MKTPRPLRVGRQMETEEQRKFWRDVEQSAKEVDQWPAWLRGVDEGTPSTLNTPEPPPVHNDKPAVWDLVIADMKDRDNTGAAKYGTRLQPHNGRNALVDAYQEALDLVVYLRQRIEEEKA